MISRGHLGVVEVGRVVHLPRARGVGRVGQVGVNLGLGVTAGGLRVTVGRKGKMVWKA